MTESPYEMALNQLPEAYALVLRLTAAGTPEDAICRQLSIEPEGLESLLDLARRKLSRRLSEP